VSGALSPYSQLLAGKRDQNYLNLYQNQCRWRRRKKKEFYNLRTNSASFRLSEFSDSANDFWRILQRDFNSENFVSENINEPSTWPVAALWNTETQVKIEIHLSTQLYRLIPHWQRLLQWRKLQNTSKNKWEKCWTTVLSWGYLVEFRCLISKEYFVHHRGDRIELFFTNRATFENWFAKRWRYSKHRERLILILD